MKPRKKPKAALAPAVTDLAQQAATSPPEDDLLRERPTAAIDRQALEMLLKHERLTKQAKYDFIIDLIDHGALWAIALIGLILVLLGHGKAEDVKTILGAVMAIFGSGAAAARQRRKKPRR